MFLSKRVAMVSTFGNVGSRALIPTGESPGVPLSCGLAGEDAYLCYPGSRKNLTRSTHEFSPHGGRRRAPHLRRQGFWPKTIRCVSRLERDNPGLFANDGCAAFAYPPECAS